MFTWKPCISFTKREKDLGNDFILYLKILSDSIWSICVLHSLILRCKNEDHALSQKSTKVDLERDYYLKYLTPFDAWDSYIVLIKWKCSTGKLEKQNQKEKNQTNQTNKKKQQPSLQKPQIPKKPLTPTSTQIACKERILSRYLLLKFDSSDFRFPAMLRYSYVN